MTFVQAILAVTVAASLLGTGAAQAHDRDPLLRFLDRIIVDARDDVRQGYRSGRDDDDDRGLRRGRDDDGDDRRDDNDDDDGRGGRDDDDGRGGDDDD